MSFLPILLFATTLIVMADEEIPKQNPYTAENDVARGKQLFNGQCRAVTGPLAKVAAAPT